MKKLALIAALSTSAFALSASVSLADYELTILHINDLHSRIQSINAFDSTCSAEDEAEGDCFGGIARVATKINERRDALTGEGRNVVVLDAGDQFQGSLFYTTYKGADTVEFMNAIGFDAMALGNHEFDDGPPMLAEFIDAAEFPVISGNTVVADAETVLAGKIEEWTVVEQGGERVGILSVLATDTDVTSSGGPNVTFGDEIEYLQDAVARMEEEGIDKIILLSHVGFVRDQEIAAAVNGIDVIVGGHSHTLLSNTEEGAPAYPTMVANPAGTEVPIVQAYAYSKYLGELTVTWDDDGNLVSAVGDTILLDGSVEPDATLAARVEELAGPLEELMAQPVSEATAPIDGSRETCRAEECTMGNLVADAMLDRVRDQGVVIAIQNGGGLRASIDAGEITMGDVLAVLPFQNTLATFEMTGADIVASLEQGVSLIEEGAGRFPQVAGLRYSFDTSVAPGEGRITSVEVEDGDGWTAIDPAATYGVATNNFMRGGGDGYALFETNAENAYDFGPGLEMVVADYLAENRPYAPELDGRITNATLDAAEEPAEEEAAAPPAEEAPAEAEAPAMEEEAPVEEDVAEMPAEEETVTPPAEEAPAEAEAPAIEEAAPVEEDVAEMPAGEETVTPPAAEAPAEAEAPAMEEAAPVEEDVAEMPAEEETVTPPAEEAPAEAEAPAMEEAAPVEEEVAALPVEEETAARTHVVQRGDTYWDLASELYGDPLRWEALAAANPDIPANNLPIGATLNVPADD